MPIMLDSSVYLDIFNKDERWYTWSATAFADAVNGGKVILNSVIYAEISVQFNAIEELETLLDHEIFEYRTIPREAAFLAGKCFLECRKRGGHRASPLPDFFIGAHAAVCGFPLATRDPKRFRSHFPALQLIAP